MQLISTNKTSRQRKKSSSFNAYNEVALWIVEWHAKYYSKSDLRYFRAHKPLCMPFKIVQLWNVSAAFELCEMR